MADAADYAALGTGLAGAAGGAAVANSDRANAFLVRLLTQRKPQEGAPDFRVPVYAGADYNLTHGSGEAVMGSRISRMLNRHGVGSYYVNSQGGWPMADTTQEWFQNDGWKSPYVKRNAGLWANEMRINGSNLDNLRNLPVNLDGHSGTALSALLAKMKAAGIPEQQALQLLQSGKFNNFTPGELLDTFKTVGDGGVQDIVSGRAPLVPKATFDTAFRSQKLPYALSSEASMDYSSMSGGNADRIAQNTFPYPEAPNTRNLSLDTRFQANYRAGGDPLIPGSGVYDPGLGRRSRLARAWKYYAPKALGGGERSQYLSAIRRLEKENGIPRDGFWSRLRQVVSPSARRRYMLISTGAAGANAAEKLRLAEQAFGTDPKVRVLLQYGKNNPASGGLDLYTNNGLNEELARIRAKRPDFVMPFARDPDYGTLARNVNLHGTYGGSSSLTEALSYTNPTVTMSDTLLNNGNNAYGTARRGFKNVASGQTALGRVLQSGKSLDTPVNTRDRYVSHIPHTTLGQALEGYGLQHATPATFDALEREGVQTLRDAMYRSPGKFSKGTVAAANRIIPEQASRNKRFLDTVRYAVTDAIDRHDASRYAAMKPGLAKALRGINRGLFKTPMGRRIGIPLAIAGALGLGGGTYALTK